MANDPFQDLIPQQSAASPKPFKTPYGQQVQGGFTGTPSRGDFSSSLQHLGAIGQEVGRDVVNLPNTILPSVFNPIINPNYDFYKEKNIEQGFADDAGKELAEYYLPGKFADKAVKASRWLSKAPNLAGNVLGSALYNGYENKKNQLNGLEGSLDGAEAGLIGTGFGKVIDKAIIQPAAKFIGRQAINPLAKKALPKIKELGEPQGYADMLKKSHDVQHGQEDLAWKEAQKRAGALDEMQGKIPGSKFNASPYDEHIANYENKANALEPSKKIDYLTSLDFINNPRSGAKALSPQSFEGIVANRQAINKGIQKYYTENNILKGDPELKKFARSLKQVLKQTAKNNTPPTAPARGQLFDEAWEDANKESQKTRQFYAAPNQKGRMVVQKDLEKALTNKSDNVDAAVLDFFSPKTRKTGTKGFDRLSKLIGKENAQNALQSHLFQGVESGNINEMVREYNKLNRGQRKAIMGNSAQGKYLEAAGKLQRSLGESANGYAMHGFHGLLGFGAPGAAAGLGSLALGASPEESFKIGVGVGGTALGAGMGASRLVPFMPKSANLLSRVGKEGRRGSGRLASLGALEGMNYFNQGRDNGSPGNTATD